MKTKIDDCYEVILDVISYDGTNLSVKVVELFKDKQGVIETNSDSRIFNIIFNSVASYLVIGEFAESVANLIKTNEKGFIRKLDNQELTRFLGLDVVEIYEDLSCYGLITAHEIVITFCASQPIIELLDENKR